MIRKATLHDLKEVCDMGWELNILHTEIDDLMQPKQDAYGEYAPAYGAWIQDSHYIFLVAEESGEIIGYVIGKVEVNEPIYELKEKGIVIAMFVKKVFRQKGVMKTLMEHLEGEFKQRNVPFISLLVHARNETAVKAWQKIGCVTDSFYMTKKI